MDLVPNWNNRSMWTILLLVIRSKGEGINLQPHRKDLVINIGEINIGERDTEYFTPRLV